MNFLGIIFDPVGEKKVVASMFRGVKNGHAKWGGPGGWQFFFLRVRSPPGIIMEYRVRFLSDQTNMTITAVHAMSRTLSQRRRLADQQTVPVAPRMGNDWSSGEYVVDSHPL